MITAVCREVRATTTDGKRCVVIASREERADIPTTDSAAATDMTEVKDRLRAQGIVLGGPLQAAPRASTQRTLASPIQILVHDDQGNEHRWIADQLDEYSLTSGSTLFYLYVPETPYDCRWLVGRTLQIAELGARSPGIAEPRAAEISRDAGSTASTIRS